jgi:Putative transposase
LDTIVFGPRAGRKVLTLREAMPIDTDSDYERKPLCANEQGFSLHAAVHCHANERLKLERLCRYITRPALANDRVKINGQGQLELKLKTPWRDGTAHHEMSPLTFMQRLAGWAKLLKRVFNLDLTRCPHFGNELRIIVAIVERQAIKKILNHLGLEPQPPPRAPAGGQMMI